MRKRERLPPHIESNRQNCPLAADRRPLSTSSPNRPPEGETTCTPQLIFTASNTQQGHKEKEKQHISINVLKIGTKVKI